MSQPLAGKVALVTGARGGIGAAIAEALAGAGATVALCGRRPGDCEPVVARIAAAGGKAFDQGLDVADLAGIRPAVDAVVERAGRLDILVNNAGTIEPQAPIAGLGAEDFDRAMRVNVSGPAGLIAVAWPHLSGGGRIVNILSGAAFSPLHGWAAYSPGKAALLMLTRAADLEGAQSGIRCFGLAPGLVDTDMQARIRAARINRIAEVPQGDLTPPEPAGRAVAWLASGNADDLAGGMVDIRDPAFRARVDL